MSAVSGSALIVGNFLSSVVSTRGVCEDLAVRLSETGWRIFTTSSRPQRINRLVDMLRTIWQRRADYQVAQVDVYSGNAFLWAEAACWALRRANKPYTLTLHGGNLPRFARHHPARVRNLLTSAEVVTTPSRYLLEHMQPYRSDLLLLPNPLDIRAYEFKPRQQLRPQLIWLRAFHETYNPMMAPGVISELVGSFPDIAIKMIGPDKQDGSKQRMLRRAAELGVVNRISLPGAVAKSEVPKQLASADIFLNTTNVDNTPVSVLEAMACGLCVVSTDVGGIPYLVRHEYDALLVPANDPVAMAAAVRRLLSDPALAESLSRNARKTAEQFDWSKILPQWQSLLFELVEKQAHE